MTRLLVVVAIGAGGTAACGTANHTPPPTDVPTKPPATATATFEAFDAGDGGVAVWTNETDRTVRRLYAGTVASIDPDPAAGGSAVVLRGSLQRTGADGTPLPVGGDIPDIDRFRVYVPAKLDLPFAIGDELRVEIWTVQVGMMAWDIHATVLRGGEPVILFNEAPAGWTFTYGDPLPGQTDMVVTSAVTVTPPQQPPFATHGWMRGAVDGVGWAVYGYAQTLDQAQAQQFGPPADFAPTLLAAFVRTSR